MKTVKTTLLAAVLLWPALETAAAPSEFNIGRSAREYKRARKEFKKDAGSKTAEDFALHAMDDGKIDALIRSVHKKVDDFSTRVELFSELHLGIPFQWGPLGEGSDGAFDSHAVISFKTVDCVTFIEQTLAMALEKDLASATKSLQKIRYKNGRILFRERNHFTSTDWIPNNIAAGYLKDITAAAAGKDVAMATMTIRKEAWYAGMKSRNLEGGEIKTLPGPLKGRLLKALQQVGIGIPDRKAELPYVPMDKLPMILPKIPSGTIVSIIRQEKEDIPVLVSHQGLLIRKGKNGAPIFRHAAFGGTVVDVPFLEYFFEFYNSEWPIRGLNFTVPLVPPRE